MASPMISLLSKLLILLISTCLLAVAEDCNIDKCRLPSCRCFNDPRIPGNLQPEDTPQIILITFDQAINVQLSSYYEEIFGVRTNPNGCLNAGTFFMQDLYTDYNQVKKLRMLGHEFGVTSLDGTLPHTYQEWYSNLGDMKAKLKEKVGLQDNEVVGVRAPDLMIGSNMEFDAMQNHSFVYDATCPTTKYMLAPNLKWPYTYEYEPWARCEVGTPPVKTYKGMWQILLPSLIFNYTMCSTPSGCWQADTVDDVFVMLYERLLDHYNSNRAPLLLAMDPNWVSMEYARKGTITFLDYARAAFPDTWIITATQALEWVKTPVPNESTNDFAPWQCPKKKR